MPGTLKIRKQERITRSSGSLEKKNETNSSLGTLSKNNDNKHAVGVQASIVSSRDTFSVNQSDN